MPKRLRSGYTTGACAAAASKAAAMLLKEGTAPEEVEIIFPDGRRHSFTLFNARLFENMAFASVIKDAGDDPDVTNGAEIQVAVSFVNHIDDGHLAEAVKYKGLWLRAGKGVGLVTKPGLAVSVGEPAINPVPRYMIASAVHEVMANKPLIIEVSVKNGARLAEKTLNSRLGIVGGLSILGTTGIVKPISAEAWTATIKASMDVAREIGVSEVVISTGRTSERGAQSVLNLPVEAYAMMGDYLGFSLQEAAKHGFSKIHLAAMWAKMVKAALRVPQTHVRNGALEMDDAARLMARLGAEGELLEKIKSSNTAREIYEHLHEAKHHDMIRAVCQGAKDYAMELSGMDVEVYLVNNRATVVEHV